MRQVTVSEEALRELVRETLDNKMNESNFINHSDYEHVNVNNVVDPSAAVTDISNSDFCPQNAVELQVAIKALSDDLPADQVPDIYKKIISAMKISTPKNDGDPIMNSTKKDTKAESVVRAAVRKQIKEAFPKKQKKFGPVVGPMPPVTKIPAGVHGGEYTRKFEKSKFDLKSTMKNAPTDEVYDDEQSGDDDRRKFNTVSDVDGTPFQDMAKKMGFSVAGAKQAVDKALAKAQWVGKMHDENPDDLEIIVLSSMNDYIKYLTKSGELTSADVQLMKDHPDIVRELDGFREFLDKAIRKARKGTELENPLGEGKYGDDYPSFMDDEAYDYSNEPCDYCGSENTERNNPTPSMTGYGEDSSRTCLDCKKTSFSGPEIPRLRRNESRKIIKKGGLTIVLEKANSNYGLTKHCRFCDQDVKTFKVASGEYFDAHKNPEGESCHGSKSHTTSAAVTENKRNSRKR